MAFQSADTPQERGDVRLSQRGTGDTADSGRDRLWSRSSPPTHLAT